MEKDIRQFDQVLHFWCPMLGQSIQFDYCRSQREGLPCHRVETCFGQHFPVGEFLMLHYTPQEIQACLAPPKGRLQRVVEAMASAEKNPK